MNLTHDKATQPDAEALAYYLGPQIPRTPAEKALYLRGKALHQGGGPRPRRGVVATGSGPYAVVATSGRVIRRFASLACAEAHIQKRRDMYPRSTFVAGLQVDVRR